MMKMTSGVSTPESISVFIKVASSADFLTSSQAIFAVRSFIYTKNIIGFQY